MTDQTTPDATPEVTVTPTSVADLHAYDEARQAEAATRQAEAEAAVLAAPALALKATADAERAEYLKATEPTRNAPDYVERFAAYDTARLAFILFTIGTSAKAARDAAKALGHEGSHIETRPV